MLKNAPHAFDIFRRISPVALRVQVSQKQFMLQTMLNRGNCARDFASDKSFAAPRAFVVKQNAIARAESVTLAIVYGGPIGKNFRDAVRAARPERRALRLRNLLRFAKHFATRSLLETLARSLFSNRFQYANRTDAGYIGIVFLLIESYSR